MLRIIDTETCGLQGGIVAVSYTHLAFFDFGVAPVTASIIEGGECNMTPKPTRKTIVTTNRKMCIRDRSYGLPRISIGDLRYMYLADLIKREKQFDKIMQLFGYANPYRCLLYTSIYWNAIPS